MMINKEKLKIYGLIILIILVLICVAYFIGGQVGRASRELELDISKQNIAALSEQVEVIKNENGELIFSKNALSMSVNELEKINAGLAAQIKASKNKVLSMSEIILTYEKNYSGLLEKYSSDVKVVKDDRVSGKLDTSEFDLSWHLKSNDILLREMQWDVSGAMNVTVFADSGKIQIVRADNRLDNIKINLMVYSGLEYDTEKKLYKATVACADTNVRIGVSNWIDPETFFKKEKNWSIGIQAGIGVSGFDKNLKFTIPIFYIGIGISRNIFNF